jgi:hypothetical protein
MHGAYQCRIAETLSGRLSSLKSRPALAAQDRIAAPVSRRAAQLTLGQHSSNSAASGPTWRVARFALGSGQRRVDAAQTRTSLGLPLSAAMARPVLRSAQRC